MTGEAIFEKKEGTESVREEDREDQRRGTVHNTQIWTQLVPHVSPQITSITEGGFCINLLF